MADFPDDLLRRFVAAGRVEWRTHALERLHERGFTRAGILGALPAAERIETYAEDRPYPSALLLGFCGSRPFHAVVAVDAAGETAYIVTVYEPDLERFEPGFRTRRKS